MKKNLSALFMVLGLFIMTSTVKAQVVTPPIPAYGITFYENNFGDLSHVIATFGNGSGSQTYNNPFYYIPVNTLVDFSNYKLHPPSESTSINDRARSAVVSATGPIKFTIYDSPSGSTGDDYVIITVKRAVTNYYLGSLETAINDSDLQVDFHHHNGLDGKVSSMRVTQ